MLISILWTSNITSPDDLIVTTSDSSTRLTINSHKFVRDEVNRALMRLKVIDFEFV